MNKSLLDSNKIDRNSLLQEAKRYLCDRERLRYIGRMIWNSLTTKDKEEYFQAVLENDTSVLIKKMLTNMVKESDYKKELPLTWYGEIDDELIVVVHTDKRILLGVTDPSHCVVWYVSKFLSSKPFSLGIAPSAQGLFYFEWKK